MPGFYLKKVLTRVHELYATDAILKCSDLAESVVNLKEFYTASSVFLPSVPNAHNATLISVGLYIYHWTIEKQLIVQSGEHKTHFTMSRHLTVQLDIQMAECTVK